MTKELRRLSLIVLFMFVALFASTSLVQVVFAGELSAHPDNRRTLYDSYEVQRGSIIAGGEEIASSVKSDDVYTWQRQYPGGDVWSTVTGYINPVLQSSSGLEHAMNEELSGTANSQFFARIEQILTGKPQRGSNVAISLDPIVQETAYRALADRGYQGGLVAIEPSTGRILAMVSTPGWDANALAGHDANLTTQNYDALLDAPGNPLYNRGMRGGLNPPGSTFKLVVAAAALESGRYSQDSTIPNPASFQLPQTSSVVHNAGGGTCGGGSTVTLADALRLSCNVPFAQLAIDLGDKAIKDTAEKFGFNRSFSTPLTSIPSEYPGSLDDPQTGLTGFGQGQVTATPLQMAMVSAGIANGGVVMNPQMVDQVLADDLSVQHEFGPTEFGRAMDGGMAGTLATMMAANVQDGAAGGARIDGVDVAGKTGTSENGDRPYSLWFTGFAPAEDPQVAVAVVVEDGGGMGQSGSGNEIAAPVAKQVMEAVLGR